MLHKKVCSTNELLRPCFNRSDHACTGLCPRSKPASTISPKPHATSVGASHDLDRTALRWRVLVGVLRFLFREFSYCLSEVQGFVLSTPGVSRHWVHTVRRRRVLVGGFLRLCFAVSHSLCLYGLGFLVI